MTGVCCATGGCHEPECLQLTEHETAVCQTVCSSGAPVGFSHVKKTVGLHQELVSHILRRLLVYGAIQKEDGKYRCGTGQ